MWYRLQRKHPAQIAVLAPIAIITFIGVLGLVIDIGVFRLIDSELESAADAAALAAAWYDPVCPNNPQTDPNVDLRCAPDNAPNTAPLIAQQFANYNLGLAGALCGSPPSVDPVNGVLVHAIQTPRAMAVTVIVQCRASYLAGRILGLGSTEITRWGTAAIGEEQNLTAASGNGRSMGEYVPYRGLLSPPLIAGLVPQ